MTHDIVSGVADARVLRNGSWTGEPVSFDAAGRIAGDGHPATAIDVGGRRVVPGMIDVQINGGWGIDLQAEPGRLWELAARLPEIGVTSFLPTLTTNGAHHLDEALAAWAAGPPPGFVGADPIGWHLEGPWLAAAKRGAHRDDRLRPIPPTLPDSHRPQSGVRLVTLAPELDGAEAAVRELAGRGVVVSLGHTAVLRPDADAAFGWGATMGTHLFNAMVGLHHRDPGLAAALLLGEHRPAMGLIVDGHHVAPDMVDLAWRLASDRIVLVSDAVTPLGVTDRPVWSLPDGTLAGAVVGLDANVVNLIEFTGCSDAAAYTAASTRPAELLGITDRGTIEPGRRGDLVVLGDDGTVELTIVGGRVAHRVG